MRVRNIELHFADARVCSEELERVTHVYMFNPIPCGGNESGHGKFEADAFACCAPRRLAIIYKFPVCHEAIVAAGFLHRRNFHFRHLICLRFTNWQKVMNNMDYRIEVDRNSDRPYASSYFHFGILTQFLAPGGAGA